ncbi:hypothetical protein BDV95DRAFT_610173 [Massariosphaeria phaeospora]|uniref:Zinc finger PHD-type domain-containing protein n=1 Tax=Massariosphaeria phaeospora TaxID=100035 RepID=A0A7C8M7S8_9PLEO|nr:hypothetical protein BDV95DRAFT_610173 [Massariosphaeria phaeospora]
MSPRRSSRARTTQPSVPAAASTSSSSVSSARTERASRLNQKQSSPQKSSTPHSLSSEEIDDPALGAQAEPPLTRRRTREQDNDEEEPTKPEDEVEDEIAEEDEITRCVCGQQEYPGQPVDTGKSREGQISSLIDSDIQNDDAGGLFIQCDVCKVWQHGGCVGIMDEAASPDEYFCEQCRKDLHKLFTSSKGQKYSRYLPVYELHHGKTSRKPSLSKEVDNRAGRDKDRTARSSAESFSKRRSTMNSRAAYDEDEVLRKVLEESKIEGGLSQSESGIRKKRSRDESEEVRQEIKRQRTNSRTPSNSPAVESEDEALKNGAPKQKPRGAAARSQREKELRDKERERERTEAANRRKGRAERRKADDPEGPEPRPSEEPTMAPSVTDSIPPETPLADLKPAPAPRKSGRPPVKRGGRMGGRGQHLREAVAPSANGASPVAIHDTPNSPQISVTNGVGNGHDSSDGAVNKQAKTKNWRLEKLSWNDIRRPAGAMQNYIAQRQVELAGEKHSPAPPVQAPVIANGETTSGEPNPDEEELGVFKKLSTLQMMDDLSRDLVHWQRMVSERPEK